jgi:hypothetical protein
VDELIGLDDFIVKLLFPDKAIGTTKRKDPLFKEIPGWPL